MATADDLHDAQASLSLLPSYEATSTGSLRLAGLRDRNPSMLLDFEAEYRKPRTARRSLRQGLRRAVVGRCSGSSIRRCLKNVPVVKMFGGYWGSGDLVKDAVAGVTVGVMVVPQAMAFSLVAKLPPETGLYMAFFSSLVYVCLGTGRHLAWNCVAVLAIMMGGLLDSYDSRLRYDLQQQWAGTTSIANPYNGPAQGGHNLSFPVDGVVVTSASIASSPSDRSRPSAPADMGDSETHGSVSGRRLTEKTDTSMVSDTLTDQTVILGHPPNQQLHNCTDGSGSMKGTGCGSGQPKLQDVIMRKKVEMACAVTFLSGVITVVCGKLGMGKMAALMSDSLIVSFTVGVAFHVLVGQMETGLGLQLPVRAGFFKFFIVTGDILTNIHHSNPITVLIFLLSSVIIYVVKRFVNEKYAHRLKVTVPVELLVLIVVTAINYFLKLNESHSVDVVREIPMGFQKPELPYVSVGLGYLSQGIVIMLVAFTQTIALGKIMALKHGYRIDCNQEMFALGVASVVCSFFSGFFPGASITCTVLQESSGGRTQVSSLFSSLLVLCTVLFLGPAFYFLPTCVLAAIVILNIRPIFLKLGSVPALWHKSRADAIVWVSTCFATVVLDTEIGLVVGIIVSIAGILLRSRSSTVDVLGEASVGEERLWISVEKYRHTQELTGVKVVRVNRDLYFINADMIIDLIGQKTGTNSSTAKGDSVIVVENTSMELPVDRTDSDEVPGLTTVVMMSPQPDCTMADTDQKQSATSRPTYFDSKQSVNNGYCESRPKQLLNDEYCDSKQSGDNTQSAKYGYCDKSGHNTEPHLSPFSVLVLDLSGVSFIDLMGVEALQVLFAQCEAVGITVFLSHLPPACAHTLKTTGFLEKHCDKVFVTTNAAFQHILDKDEK